MSEKWQRKVRGLLALAESTDNAEEAQAFYAKAQSLMLAYGLDEAMLNRRQEEHVEPTTARLEFKGTYARAWVSAAFSVSSAAGCKGVYGTHYGRGGRGAPSFYVSLVGMPDDIEFVQVVMASVTLQCANAWKAWKASRFDWSAMEASDKVKSQKSYIVGYGMGVGDKIRRARAQTVAEKVTQHGTGTELVLASREHRVAAEYARLHPARSLGKGRSMNVGGRAFGEGRTAGGRADVGGTSLGGGGRAISA